jgi:glycerophosphoryl diester phosphodiesterase
VLGQGRAAPILVGHHGVPSQAPENTLAGIRKLCELGIPGVEVDVRFTADSVPVLLHDRDVRRTSNGAGYVDEMRLADLEQLDFGSWFGPQYVGEPIPTLINFLAVSAACVFDLVQLDVKSFSPLSVDSGLVRVGRAVNAAGLLGRVQMASDFYAVRRAAALAPGLHTLVWGGVITPAYADLLIQSHIDAVGVRFDEYQASADQLARLDSAGVMIGVWSPPGVLELNTLSPVPLFVTSDWAWTFTH